MKYLLFIIFFAMTTPTYAFTCSGTPVYMHNGYIEGDAYWDEDTNEIHLSRKFLNKWSADTQKFIMAHECGHANGNLDEMDADRFAFRNTTGNMSASVVKEICKSLGPYNKSRCNAIQKMQQGK